MDKKKQKYKIVLFQKITNLNESEQLIKEMFWSFMGAGLLLIAVAMFLYFIDPKIIFGFIGDGFIYIVLSLIFYFKKSRIAAIILLILSAIGVVTTTMAKFGYYEGGKNIFLAIFIFICGINSVRAIFTYYKFKSKIN